jgi:hypothetical protein
MTISKTIQINEPFSRRRQKGQKQQIKIFKPKKSLFVQF